MRIANSTLDRCHDYAGSVVDVFRAAADLGDIARTARPDPHELADQAFEKLTQNAHGQYDRLIAALTPALPGTCTAVTIGSESSGDFTQRLPSPMGGLILPGDGFSGPAHTAAGAALPHVVLREEVLVQE